MKYVRNFDSFRKNKPVNEELLGGLLNWFKKMWDKAVKDLEALKDDPNAIKDWVIKNAFNPKDDTNVFSQVVKDFEKKEAASVNDQTCLDLIDSIMDPQTGSLGKQGIGVLLANKALQGEELKAKRTMLEYIVNTSRNQTIVKIKFAGGPSDGKIDPKKKTASLDDANHLPDLKKILKAKGKPEDKKKETSTWITGQLIPMLQNFVKAIKEDDIRAYLKKQGIEIGAGEGGMDYEKLKELFDKKTPVLYLLKDKTKEDWDKLTDEEKKKPGENPASDIVGMKPINALNDQNKEDSVIFLDKNDQPNIKKGYDDIMGEAGEERSEEAKKAAESLGKIKDDPEKMKIVADVADALEDPKKAEEIKKATGAA